MDPDPPWPPPDPTRPFDWEKDDVEWGEGPAEDWVGCLMVGLAAVAVGFGMVILYVTLLR